MTLTNRLAALGLAGLLVMVSVESRLALGAQQSAYSFRAVGERLSRPSRAVSPDNAAAIVRDSTGARVLGVRLSERAGQAAYRVKVLLPGGRVRVFHVDARTGRVLE